MSEEIISCSHTIVMLFLVLNPLVTILQPSSEVVISFFQEVQNQEINTRGDVEDYVLLESIEPDLKVPLLFQDHRTLPVMMRRRRV